MRTMGIEPALSETRAAASAAVVVQGLVESGDRRGRELGFPTANLRLDDGLDHDHVRDGVWAGHVVVADSGVRYVCAVSVGRRPTFYKRDGERLLEAYLLDFDGDLYGRSICVELHEFLRPQRRFRGVSELVAQLAVDVADTRAWAERP